MKQNRRLRNVSNLLPTPLLYLLITTISFTATNKLMGQQSLSYQANILSEGDNVVEIGNLLIYDIDSNLLHGEVFYDGKINETNIPMEAYRLEISSLGYQSHFIIPVSAENLRKFATIVLHPIELEGVEVISSKQMVEQNGTDLIVHVANTPLSNAGSIMDVIQQSPKVSLGRGGQVSILGKGIAKIYLNGQEITSLEILKNLSSTDISKLEILENPPAKYDAQGQSVINIISRQKSIEGYKINALQEVGYGKFYRSYYEGRAYVKKGKLLLEGNYGYKPWSWGGRNNQIRTHTIDGDILDIDSRFTYKNERNDHSFGVRAQYDLPMNGNFGLQWIGSTPSSQRSGKNDRIVANNEAFDFSIISNLDGPIKQENNTYRAYIQTSFNEYNNLQFNLQYTAFDQVKEEYNEQVISTETATDIFQRRTFNTNGIDVYTAQLDLSSNIPEKGINIEYGLKNAFIANRSKVIFESANDNEIFSRLDDFSNAYDYEENILSSYAQIDVNKNQWSILAGLRGEWTSNNGLSGFEGVKESFDNNYFNIFPSVKVTHQWNDKVTQSLNYSYRINRPTFQHLNPFIFFVDSLVSLNGNPRLRPEYSNNLSHSIQLNNWRFTVNYTFTRDKINNIYRSTDPNNETVIAFGWENLRSTSLLSADVSWPFNFNKYNGYFTLGGFFDNHQVEDIGQLAINKKAGYFIQSNHSVQLPAKIAFNAQINYTSSRVDGIYIDNPISFINLSLSRKFLNDHLTVRLWANDIFDNYKFTGNVDFGNLRANYLSEGDWHFIKLTLNWDLGKLKPKTNSSNVSKDELNRINRNL